MDSHPRIRILYLMGKSVCRIDKKKGAMMMNISKSILSNKRKSLLKVIEHVENCFTYTVQFCLGRGYAKFNCWQCDSDINVEKRTRFIKCPQCSRWNMHPIWSDRGESPASFSKKIYLPALLALTLFLVCTLTLGWCASVYFSM